MKGFLVLVTLLSSNTRFACVELDIVFPSEVSSFMPFERDLGIVYYRPEELCSQRTWDQQVPDSKQCPLEVKLGQGQHLNSNLGSFIWGPPSSPQGFFLSFPVYGGRTTLTSLSQHPYFLTTFLFSLEYQSLIEPSSNIIQSFLPFQGAC